MALAGVAAMRAAEPTGWITQRNIKRTGVAKPLPAEFPAVRLSETSRTPPG